MSSELGAFILLTPKRFPLTPSLSPSGGEGQGEGEECQKIKCVCIKNFIF
jgi:hypothetical protein